MCVCVCVCVCVCERERERERERKQCVLHNVHFNISETIIIGPSLFVALCNKRERKKERKHDAATDKYGQYSDKVASLPTKNEPELKILLVAHLFSY